VNVDVGPLRLLGYDRPTEPLRAGGPIPLTLFWQRRQPGDAPFLLSLQLRQGDQAWQRQQPHPISEMYLPALWQTGEIVREQWQALLPAQAPNGRYDLVLSVIGDGNAPLAEVPLGQVEVTARDHRYDLPAPQLPIQPALGSLSCGQAQGPGATLGQSARLLGYDLEPQPATPGGVVTVTLYWQALAEMDTAYTVFVHLVDAGGQIRAQRDRPPLDGAAPTTGWVPGEVLRDEYQITLSADTPPGRYTLRVGLYDPLTWQRLPLTAGNGGPDYAELGPVEVSP
jgi:hypothetical protein